MTPPDPFTPAPFTPAPSTPAPSTPAPSTPAPSTPNLVTHAPCTPGESTTDRLGTAASAPTRPGRPVGGTDSDYRTIAASGSKDSRGTPSDVGFDHHPDPLGAPSSQPGARSIPPGGRSPLLDDPSDLFEDLPSVSEVVMRRLLDRLTVDAASHGVLDVAYRTVDSPVGPLLLAATERGLARVAFASEGHDAVLVDLAHRISPRILFAPHKLDEAAQELDDYFAGDRRRFDLAVDLQLASGFRREVLVHLVEVGYGATASYAHLAERSGRPRAVRAAATACATNPVPIVVPCHRVIRSDGSTGNYRGGAEAKTLLLSLESR